MKENCLLKPFTTNLVKSGLVNKVLLHVARNDRRAQMGAFPIPVWTREKNYGLVLFDLMDIKNEN